FSAQMPDLHERVSGVISDAAFSSFRDIAREKLGGFWLTWPLQYPLSWLIPADFDPKHYVGRLSPTPLLLIHSVNDTIIPPHHAQMLFNTAADTKYLLNTTTPHNGTFGVADYRSQVLEFMQVQSNKENASYRLPDSRQDMAKTKH